MIIPTISPRTWAVILCAGLLVAGYRVEESRVAHARERASELALQASNTLAERDSTRRVEEANRRVARLLGDSLRLVERMVEQKVQRQDALDRALRRERLARYAMTVRAESLVAMARTAPEAEQTDTSSAVRRASFHIRQAPYTMVADVALPEAPDTGTMSVRVALDPLHVEARVSCAPADRGGIRGASVSATGPAWADIRFDRVEQSADLCASPALVRERRRSAWLPMMLGTGAVLDSHGRVGWGVLVGMGFGLKR